MGGATFDYFPVAPQRDALVMDTLSKFQLFGSKLLNLCRRSLRY
jgi:hypothetical protein